jgi:hypothetical protein
MSNTKKALIAVGFGLIIGITAMVLKVAFTFHAVPYR